MDQEINKKMILLCCSFLFGGIILGSTLTSMFKFEEKPETIKIDYDSVCMRTLKSYYLEQNQNDKKKILMNGIKKTNLTEKL